MASALLFAVSVFYMTNLQWYFVQAEIPSPKFLPTVTNVTVNKGSTAELPCPVQNIGTETVTWRRASSSAPLTVGAFTFTSDIRISVTQPSAHNLHIRNVSPDDAGLYICAVTKRNLSHAVALTVQGGVQVPGVKISGPQYVEEGHAFRLVCIATGAVYPDYDIYWFKDGGRITPDDRLLITKSLSMKNRTFTSDLFTDRAKMADAGTYVCRAEDDQITSTRLTIIKGIYFSSTGTSAMHTALDVFQRDRETWLITTRNCEALAGVILA